MLLLIPIAFLSGVLTVFSPCVLPILPIILASGIEGKISRVRGVIVGLVVSFTIASLFLATIVKVFGIPADTIREIAVVLLVIFGLMLIFPIIWEKILVFIERIWKIAPLKDKSNGFIGGFITGVSLGIVWTPCIGPVVATVATLAAVNSFSFATVAIAVSYAVGTGVPLYLIAKGGKTVTTKLAVFRQNNQTIRQVFGVIILVTALFIFSGADRKLQAWTLNTLPQSWTQIATNFENRIDVSESLAILKQQNKPQEKALRQNSGQVQPGTTVVRSVKLADDFSGAKVKPSDLLQGCFGGKDCIPSIDKPKYENAKDASWLSDEDIVFAIDYKGIKRAYPQRILNWHEIVNSEIASVPIAITFCPLCGSALAFERKVDGVITEFGVSGILHNSDLVMYDRFEGNLWQQITGEAIVGNAAQRNEKLVQIPIITTTWRQWQKENPNTDVLSRDTGYNRDYNSYPYGTYEQDDELYFGVKNLNRELPLKTEVFGIEVDGFSKAYPADIFESRQNITDNLGKTTISLEKTDSGEIMVTNKTTGEKLIPVRLFWFAWAAFHPDTELYNLK